jgi:hypothetical protein
MYCLADIVLQYGATAIAHLDDDGGERGHDDAPEVED